MSKSRKINQAKRNSTGCRNNGSCPYCHSSRTHSNRKREPVVDVSIMSAALGELTKEDGYRLGQLLRAERMSRVKTGR